MLTDRAQARGKDVARPVKTWNQCGLSSRALEVLRKAEFEAPLAIQVGAGPAACAALLLPGRQPVQSTLRSRAHPGWLLCVSHGHRS